MKALRLVGIAFLLRVKIFENFHIRLLCICVHSGVARNFDWGGAKWKISLTLFGEGFQWCNCDYVTEMTSLLIFWSLISS